VAVTQGECNAESGPKAGEVSWPDHNEILGNYLFCVLESKEQFQDNNGNPRGEALDEYQNLGGGALDRYYIRVAGPALTVLGSGGDRLSTFMFLRDDLQVRILTLLAGLEPD
jgi:hypothetical protein